MLIAPSAGTLCKSQIINIPVTLLFILFFGGVFEQPRYGFTGPPVGAGSKLKAPHKVGSQTRDPSHLTLKEDMIIARGNHSHNSPTYLWLWIQREGGGEDRTFPQ